MIDTVLPKEVAEEAEKFNSRNETSEEPIIDPVEKKKQDEEELFNLLQPATTLSELSVKLVDPEVREKFAALGLDRSEVSSKVDEIIQLLSDGEDIDIGYGKVEFPEIMQPIVAVCITNEQNDIVRARNNERDTNFRYQQLADIIRGKEYNDAALHTALALATNLGEHRGKSGTKEYTMAELAAVMKSVAVQLEKTGDKLINGETVSEIVQQEYYNKFQSKKDLTQPLLTYFSEAIAAHTRGVASNRRGITRFS